MKKIVTIGVITLTSTLLLTSCGKAPIPDEIMVKPDTEIMERQENNNEIVEQEVITKIEADTIVPENAMVKKDTFQTAGIYANYSASAVESALASGKKVALFFHAPWCPSCKSADTNLSKETLSPDIVVFKVDYDSNVELRKKYGVTYQHTFVSLNTDGTLMKKISGISSAAEVVELF